MKEEILRVDISSYENLLSGNFYLYRGEIIGLVGLHNSGILEMIQILKGEKKISRGYILLNGKKDFFDSQEQYIYFINNNTYLNEELTVEENISIMNSKDTGRIFFKYKKIRRRTQELLDLTRLSIKPQIKVFKLTTFQKDIILLLKAINEHVKIIILENIWNKYSVKEIDDFKRIINILKAYGISFICVFFDSNNFLKFMDNTFIFRRGKTVKILEKEDENFNNISFFIIGEENKRLKNSKVFNSLSKKILLVDNLKLRNIENTINFYLFPGEILGIIDENLSISTQFSRFLYGMNPNCYLSGNVYIDGISKFNKTINDALNNGIGYIQENFNVNGLCPNITIGDNLILSLMENIDKLFFNKKLSLIYANEFFNWINEYTLKKFLLTCEYDNTIKYTALIFKWLNNKPKILLLMNPFVSFDELGREFISAKIMEIRKQGGSILIFAKNMYEIEKVCDRTICFKESVD